MAAEPTFLVSSNGARTIVSVAGELDLGPELRCAKS
jgi:hypothetical protein